MNRAEVEKIAQDLGASLDEELTGHGVATDVISPAGHVWAATGEHVIGILSFTSDAPEWGELAAYMGWGLQECEDEGCAFCLVDSFEKEEVMV